MKSLLLFLCLTQVATAAMVFSDNYDRASLNSGAYTYTVTAGGDGGASIVSNQLVLTNDASATDNAAGTVIATTPTSGFSAGWDNVLSNNTQITWTINLRQIRSDPSGFVSGNYGVAVVLAGTNANIESAGNGYALYMGQSGSTDPLFFGRYTNGIEGTRTPLISGSPLGDPGANYMSVKVTYDSDTDTWELLGRNDGSSSFADPTTGTLTSIGTTVDTTYVNSTMTAIGTYWNYSTAANQTSTFDNYIITVVPEPSAFAALAGLGVLLVAVRRRR